jgi:hypothetical protein
MGVSVGEEPLLPYSSDELLVRNCYSEMYDVLVENERTRISGRKCAKTADGEYCYVSDRSCGRNRDKVRIISGQPGIGKTFFLSTYWYFDCSEASQQSSRCPNAWRVRPPFAKPFITSWMTMVCAKWTQKCSRVWPPTQKSGSSLIKRPLVIHATSNTTSGWSSSRLHLTMRTSNIGRRTIVQRSFSFLWGPGKGLSRAGE